MTCPGTYPTVLNGQMSFNSSTTVEFECLAGFAMTGNKVITCSVSGSTVTWTDAPTCSAITDDDEVFPEWWLVVAAIVLVLLVLACCLCILCYFCCGRGGGDNSVHPYSRHNNSNCCDGCGNGCCRSNGCCRGCSNGCGSNGCCGGRCGSGGGCCKGGCGGVCGSGGCCLFGSSGGCCPCCSCCADGGESGGGGGGGGADAKGGYQTVHHTEGPNGQKGVYFVPVNSMPSEGHKPIVNQPGKKKKGGKTKKPIAVDGAPNSYHHIHMHGATTTANTTAVVVDDDGDRKTSSAPGNHSHAHIVHGHAPHVHNHAHNHVVLPESAAPCACCEPAPAAHRHGGGWIYVRDAVAHDKLKRVEGTEGHKASGKQVHDGNRNKPADAPHVHARVPVYASTPPSSGTLPKKAATGQGHDHKKSTSAGSGNLHGNATPCSCCEPPIGTSTPGWSRSSLADVVLDDLDHNNSKEAPGYYVFKVDGDGAMKTGQSTSTGKGSTNKTSYSSGYGATSTGSQKPASTANNALGSKDSKDWKDSSNYQARGDGEMMDYSNNTPRPLKPAKEVKAWLPHSNPVRNTHNTSTK